jgi:hypothetical protein
MIRIVSFLIFIGLYSLISLENSYAQTQSEKKTNASTSTLKPQRLQELQGSLKSTRDAIWEEITREFNKCLPSRIGSYIPYDDPESYIRSGSLTSNATGGIAFFKSYKDSKSGTESKVIISIIANSPMVSSLASYLSDPAIARGTGKQTTEYGGFKAIEEYDPLYKTGEINLLLSDNTLVTISATDVPDGKLLSEFARSIDFARILAILD